MTDEPAAEANTAFPWARKRTGRPTKFTPPRIEKFLNALRGGAPEALACRYAGWSYSMYRAWVRRAEQARSGVLKKFLEERDQALADGEMALVVRVREAAENDWRAALELLKRRYPESYGDRSRLEVDAGPTAVHIQFEVIEPPQEVKKDAERAQPVG